MKKRGKIYKKIMEKISPEKNYDLEEAIQILKDNSAFKFDQSVEIHMNLGVDPKHADQVVRGNVVLPNGTGQTVRVVAFAKGDNAKAAEEAGAIFVGAEDLVQKITEGWLDFDKVVATPDMMPLVGRVARVLGPRGLMPNPKTGTVTPDIAKAIQELAAGKVSFRVDKGSNIHGTVGKLSFEPKKLAENAVAFIEAIIKAKPSAAKGEYVRSSYIAGTMTPSLALSKTIGR